ncbi:N-acyl-D-amino-acid deacylase family protein [Roseovarius pelagicus]|uniref:D-aminoacylase n=1 Tax=Roseovarius pelagicus TaxID=2980108 RepID=A0ABY6D9E8_9RHOB|nr:D-aminoacylase [Roseovarius pelagicus]UXX82564.1 D-aminoacylase [Roseovarius pelagicus]
MPTCDLVIKNATLLDGLGSAPVSGGVAVEAGRIVAVGAVDDWIGEQIINAEGACLAPGFIDVHTHYDQAILDQPDLPFAITQGVTSIIVGNCGISLAPLDRPRDLPAPLSLLGAKENYQYPSFTEYFEKLVQARPALNIGVLAGHGTLRTRVMADTDRAADETEIEQICVLLDEALEAGVLGLSTGLAYPVARNAPTQEVIAIASRLAAFPGARYVTHMRNERDEVVEAVEETLKIGREAGVPVVLSHHKCIGRQNFGRSHDTLALIDLALKEQDVAMDQYPYDASSTVLIPEMVGHADRVLIAVSETMPEMAGRDLSDVAAEMGCDIQEAARRLAPGVGVYFQMSEEDIERIMAHPRVMIGSDGIPGPNAHPRLWGSFPRVLGRYVREKRVLSLPEAVRRMTSLPAQVFGLARRGRLQTGFQADLVLFDPDKVIDRASYVAPTKPSEGILDVFVNGEHSLHNGQSLKTRAGQVLRRASV